ncbi:MAG: chromosomal replication initiator protein DnaA [Myxococcota bacterium]
MREIGTCIDNIHWLDHLESGGKSQSDRQQGDRSSGYADRGKKSEVETVDAVQQADVSRVGDHSEQGLIEPKVSQQWHDAYDRAMKALKNRMSFFAWEGFMKPLSLLAAAGEQCTLAAPSDFHCSWVRDHYLGELTRALSQQYGQQVQVTFRVCADHSDVNEAVDEQQADASAQHGASQIDVLPLPAAAPTPAQKPWECGVLNSAYTLDAFVAGSCNRVSFAAAQEVCTAPGTRYSPLCLVGTSGLGKTHLLQAIGWGISQKHPRLQVVYMRAEQWVNHYIAAVRQQRFDEFRDFFRRRCDVLLIDDIEFLSGKTASQEEFFHTFDRLQELRKQIVVTSHRYPHEIDNMQRPLQTRLASGLVSDLREPTLQTRIEIVRNHATLQNAKLPATVAQHIASQSYESVRELLGSLNRVMAFSRMANVALTLENAKQCLEPFVRSSCAPLTMEEICSCVATYYGLSPQDLQGNSRRKHVCSARQVAMWLCSNHMQATLVQIGTFFGKRNHTTALASVRRIEQRRSCDVSLRSVLSRLQALLPDKGKHKSASV